MSWLLLALACGSLTAFIEGGVPIGEEDAAIAWRVDGERFRLQPAGDSRLLEALVLHSRAGIPGWRVLPFARGGNFVRWRACSEGVGEAACNGGSVANDAAPGTGWREVSTLTYDAEWPLCGGVVYSAGDVPKESGWGGTVWLAVQGRGVVGDGFGAVALNVVEGAVARRIVLARREVQLGAQTLTLEADAPREEALSLLTSPENLSATVSLRYAALIARVDAARAAKTITVWKEGPYVGGGVPPDRTEVAATAAEAAALAAAARAELISDRDTALAAAEEIHHVLAMLLPARVLKP